MGTLCLLGMAVATVALYALPVNFGFRKSGALRFRTDRRSIVEGVCVVVMLVLGSAGFGSAGTLGDVDGLISMIVGALDSRCCAPSS